MSARAGRRGQPTAVRRRLRTRMLMAASALAIAASLGGVPGAAAAATQTDAMRTLERAATLMVDEFSVDGAYAWGYSQDFTVRRGKGSAIPPDAGMVQAPGMSAVGAAFLRLHEISGDERWLTAAEEVADALVSSQLLSGGWSLEMRTDPAARNEWCYRVETTAMDCKLKKGRKAANRSLLDDSITQSALRFLLWFDEVTDGRNGGVREALDYGLRSVVDYQYENGACPAWLPAPMPGGVVAAREASVPAEWSRTWVEPDGPPYYVLNDHLQRDCILLMLAAHERFDRPEYLEAAKKAGAFLVAAQLPAPQRGWAQSYDKHMIPAWGREFEPPSVASFETQGVIEALLALYAATRDKTFLTAAKEGADWLRQSELEDGKWARFYALGTNAPLYVDANLELADNLDNPWPGYSFQAPYEIAPLLERVERSAAGQGEGDPAGHSVGQWRHLSRWVPQGDVARKAAAYIRMQDQNGGWIRKGWIQSDTFVDAVFYLSRFIEDQRD